MSVKNKPLVSCIMPTANRRRFVPRAIDYFLRQTYSNKELVVVDDGDDIISDLIPDHPQVRYVRLEGKRTLGEKRNQSVERCQGNYIMHWDDDDWMANYRIQYQMDAMLSANADICGVQNMYFYDIHSGTGWLYQYTDKHRMWLAGGSLLYKRDIWRKAPFPNIQVASDTRFIFKQNMQNALVLSDYDFYVAMIHPRNTSKKSLRGAYWSRWEGDMQELMGADYAFYESLTSQPSKAPSKPPTIQIKKRTPKFCILMVVHNAREVVKLSIQNTFKHIADADAQLVVVDNASSDGIEQWLDVMSARGDLMLLRSEKNIGHGPALEYAREQTQSPFIVTLDSDAFPLQDNWLDLLESRIQGKVKVSGILHHRDYIHPSCLMIKRETLDTLDMTFLNEKHLPSKFDVAERITHAVRAVGYDIDGLARTTAQRRGSVSEPVYLGSTYEDIVYHQWYTTRADMAAGRHPIDDVPEQAIDRSLDELFRQYHAQPRDITVIMGVRAHQDEPLRLRNAVACLQALNHQSLERWRYRIVAVEQDEQPRVKEHILPYVDQYIFAYNPGAYNRSWGFNIGVVKVADADTILCLIDADLLVQSDFLSTCLTEFEQGIEALRPYNEVMYLDPASTKRILGDDTRKNMSWERYRGRVYTNSQGGCIWVKSDLYESIGGHDEAFEGWGSEDRDFWRRLSAMTRIHHLTRRIAHLYHEIPDMDSKQSKANRKRLHHKRNQTHEQLLSGQVDRYKHVQPQVSNSPISIHDKRDWEHWHRWERRRIENIIKREKSDPSRLSLREQFADQAMLYGSRILDVGCGAGALWHRLPEEAQPVGVDITHIMLRTAHQHMPRTPVFQADSGHLPFADDSFDVVTIRHLLEHLPDSLMQPTISEAIRVAQNGVIIGFYVPPTEQVSNTKRVGEQFLETRWQVSHLTEVVEDAGAYVAARLPHVDEKNHLNEVWIVEKDHPAQPVSMDSDEMKVSIIMPTYRRGHTIWQTIRHILAQTYTNWQLIIIDNAANGTMSFADDRITVYSHAQIASASYARNKGIEYCTGDVVCFFDDDDEMFPDYLETLVNGFRSHPHAKLVRCGMIVSNGRINYSYATPECCLRRQFVTQTWEGRGPAQDQRYFKRIVATNRWSEANGDIVVIRRALCHALTDNYGGLRVGRY